MKKRADVLLVEKGLVSSREKAKRIIIANLVKVEDKPVRNPSDMFEEDCNFFIAGDECPFVSRGGFKLKKAVDEFNINLNNKVCIDIGASTGGFTDCMLQNGADFVYSVDVGYGQFDWSLRNNEKVCLLERTNARYLTSETIKKRMDFCSIDVSFISLTLIIPVLKNINASDGHEIVALIKPQFEAGKEKVGKKGVVRDINVHKEVVKKIADFSLALGYAILGITYSPIKGPNGNIEYLIYLKADTENTFDVSNIDKIIDESHKSLV